MKKQKPRFCRLQTPFEELSAEKWSTVHPRPQLRRDTWQSLCGAWELSLVHDGGETAVGEVTVPFPPESRISGIERPLAPEDAWVYRRRFVLTDELCGKNILLHFGAVDQRCEVCVNGKAAGEHTGGYLPFSVDITAHLQPGENELQVTVYDPLDLALGYGKQRKKRGGMWYTPISGIWQPVWLEGVPENHIRSLRITPSVTSVVIETAGGAPEKTLVLHTDAGDLSYSYTGDRFVLSPDSPKLWSPESPYLYRFTLCSGEDCVESYFALRTVSIETIRGQAYLCLNGRPYFFHGLLDQGYYSDGIYLPASPEGYRFDVLEMKRLGFNMLRKHIKIEPDLFYYYCDLYGMAVFQDLVNSGKYSFFYDTALPTIGCKRLPQHRANKRRRTEFLREAEATVETLYNHPSVLYYTIFNEGWGQFDADHVYSQMKALDPTRVWDATSGWFWKKQSDVSSEHIYFKKIRMKKSPDRPQILSEFGGYACKIENHSFNPDKTYGYRKLAKKADFQTALAELYRSEIIPAIRSGLNATVLTQVSDVEDETNGLVTYDRRVTKVEPSAMQLLAAEVFATFAETTAEEKRG